MHVALAVTTVISCNRLTVAPTADVNNDRAVSQRRKRPEARLDQIQ